MTIELATLISVISVACAVISAIRSNRRADTSQIERKAAETAVINTKLDQIGADVRDIKYDVTAVKRDIVDLTERMVVVEQSTKSAHHRLDTLSGKESEE